MKVKGTSDIENENNLRVMVLRKTVPRSYFKYKAKLIKTMTKEATMLLLNDIKKCKNFFSKTNKKTSTTEQAVMEVKEIEKNYKSIAVNFIRKFGIGNKPHKGEKTIKDEKTGKVMKLLYL